ncbi:MAG: HD domain-containing protein [Roseimicrobium sp.]
MSGSFVPNSLVETLLFQRLGRPFSDPLDQRLALSLAASLPDVCRIAVDRMKAMPVYHPEFTLHDDIHLLRVTQLMGMVIPEEVLENTLNPVEIALLILAAHFHDVGMVPRASEVEGIKESDDFEILRSNWLLEHPGLGQAMKLAEATNPDASTRRKATEIAATIASETLSRFLRRDHAKRSAQVVRMELGTDPRLKCGTGHLADALAILCESHNHPPEFITPVNGFFYDKGIGTWRVNMTYLATVLRLADILDFDRERTPDELFRSLAITSTVSIVEWEKHRWVEAWTISKDVVRFECSCERPEYELAVRKFLNWIDMELAAAHGGARCRPRNALEEATARRRLVHAAHVRRAELAHADE